MSEQFICPTCNHSSAFYWHRLSVGLVGTLIKIRGGVGEKNENSIHLQKDLSGKNELSKTEYNNAQKLRFHGLIAHDKEAGAGYWLITARGGMFLRGELSVPLKVKTLNNRVIDHDDMTVSIRDVWQTTPYWDDNWDGERQPLKLRQAVLL
jgi:hypothetical protein